MAAHLVGSGLPDAPPCIRRPVNQPRGCDLDLPYDNECGQFKAIR